MPGISIESRRASILCVHAHADTCEMVKAVLGAEGCHVRIAPTPDAALLQIDRYDLDLDLVIIQQCLCEMCNEEHCGVLRQQVGEVPFLYLVKHKISADSEASLRARGDGHLRLPLSLHVLEREVALLLKH